MNASTFRVVYAGPALTEHVMDVRDLAPALLAIAEALEEANRVLNGTRAQVQVQVHGSFKTGSFGIDLSVVQSFVAQALDFLAEDHKVVGALNLLGLLGFAAGSSAGLIRLVRWLKGRTVKRVEIRDETGIARVITDDEELEVEVRTIELFRSYKIRNALERAIKAPLERNGVESVAFVYEEVVTEVIEKGDRYSFSSPSDDKTQISEQEFTAHLQLVTVPMRDGYKWRVDDGGGPFTATMLDDAFLQRMQRNEIPFAPGDILVARIRRRQFMQDQELHNESEILQVTRHEAAYKQIPLPIVRRED
jgi:hypothetical protein